jgi:putative transposase
MSTSELGLSAELSSALVHIVLTSHTTQKVERMIGTLRRELLDHAIILNERHLKRLLSSYLDYYHPWVTYRTSEQDAPEGRPVRTAEPDNVVEFPAFRGLHHVYLSRAA